MQKKACAIKLLWCFEDCWGIFVDVITSQRFRLWERLHVSSRCAALAFGGKRDEFLEVGVKQIGEWGSRESKQDVSEENSSPPIKEEQ